MEAWQSSSCVSMGNGATGRRDLFYMEPLIVGATGETPTMLSAWRKTEETCGLKNALRTAETVVFSFRGQMTFVLFLILMMIMTFRLHPSIA